MRILGVKIDEYTQPEALQKVALFLSQKGQKKIFTPNPELLVQAQDDPYFKEVLNGADLSLCDGKGIQLVSKPTLERIPGVDFMVALCALAAKQRKSIFLLGSSSNEIAERTAQKLQEKFPTLNIVGFDQGPRVQENAEKKLVIEANEQQKTIDYINTAKPDILFVAFGSPKQEKWITENLYLLPSVKIAMGVGGSFDFISGKVKRAPLLLRRLGLEWLYRLSKEPKRFFRIYNATFKFVSLFIKTRGK